MTTNNVIVLSSVATYFTVTFMYVRYWLGKWELEGRMTRRPYWHSGHEERSNCFWAAWMGGLAWPVCITIAGILRWKRRHPDAWKSIFYRIPSDEKKRRKLEASRQYTAKLERELEISEGT